MNGQSRYCQKCAKESLELFEVTNDALKMNQLQYCKDCAGAYKAKEKTVYNN